MGVESSAKASHWEADVTKKRYTTEVQIPEWSKLPDSIRNAINEYARACVDGDEDAIQKAKRVMARRIYNKLNGVQE